MKAAIGIILLIASATACGGSAEGARAATCPAWPAIHETAHAVARRLCPDYEPPREACDAAR